MLFGLRILSSVTKILQNLAINTYARYWIAKKITSEGIIMQLKWEQRSSVHVSLCLSDSIEGSHSSQLSQQLGRQKFVMGKSELFGATTTTKTTKLETLQSGSQLTISQTRQLRSFSGRVWQRAESEGLEWFCAATTLSVWSVLYAISAEWSQPIFFYTSWFHDSSAKLYLRTIDSTQVKLHKSIMGRYSLKTRVMKIVIIPLYYHRSTHIHMLRRHALVTKTYPECSSDQQGLDSTHS